jgi:hypothetical protein
MKYLKIILSFAILSLLLTFCVNNKSEKNSERNFNISELIGMWNQVNTDESLKNKDSKIESIQLVNDSVAKIQLVNSTGERVVIGKWENGFEKELKNLDLVIETDIKITYYPDKNSTVILLLEISEENNKLIMTGDKLKFKKE